LMTDAPILVVDDDPAIRQTVADILDLEGYLVEAASNGAEALRLLDSIRPAVVLLDMRMPVLDGWGFMSALRLRAAQPPVLVMTAARNAREWADEIGAQGHLSKPFELDDLLHAVEQFGRQPSGGAPG
jgi:two-component system chemotaxis response regulator CheY